jgi:1-acyl-sn-glycerol-3-phosphate acyltransferase
MISRLLSTIRGIISLSLMVINTIVWATPIHLLAFTKILIRNAAWQRICARAIMFNGNCWIRGILIIVKLTQGTTYAVEGLEGLSRKKWYFINCNHQSWSDILVLFRIFHGHVPFLKFFLKKQLFWVPLMGISWWALDYPFMERFSKSYLEKNPHMRGKDLDTTRKVCERYRHTPVSILNFIEGTRFTHEKRTRQQSPYQNLLRPKSGGFAFALAAMNGKISNILDVTIIYPPMRFDFWDYLCGRIPQITVRIEKLPVPEEFLQGDYQNDEVFRDRFQSWVCDLWQVKDNLIEEHRNRRPGC